MINKNTIEQWKKDFPEYADFIVGTQLKDSAFLDEELPENFYLPEGLTSIGDENFGECVLTNENFDLPTTLQNVGMNFFDNAELDGEFNWHIPCGIKVLPNGFMAQLDFHGNLTFSEGLQVISTGAFAESILKVDNPISLPQSLEIIEEGAFGDAVYNLNDRSYEIPDCTDIAFLRQWFLDPNKK